MAYESLLISIIIIRTLSDHLATQGPSAKNEETVAETIIFAVTTSTTPETEVVLRTERQGNTIWPCPFGEVTRRTKANAAGGRGSQRSHVSLRDYRQNGAAYRMLSS
jgi:hypothetical protein